MKANSLVVTVTPILAVFAMSLSAGAQPVQPLDCTGLSRETTVLCNRVKKVMESERSDVAGQINALRQNIAAIDASVKWVEMRITPESMALVATRRFVEMKGSCGKGNTVVGFQHDLNSDYSNASQLLGAWVLQEFDTENEAADARAEFIFAQTNPPLPNMPSPSSGIKNNLSFTEANFKAWIACFNFKK